MTLAITPGEPAGIGPDLILLLAQTERSLPWVVICDQDMLRSRAERLGLSIVCESDLEHPALNAGHVTVQHIGLNQPARPGQLNTANAASVLACLDAAVDGCLQSRFAALVTGPMQKSVMNDAGIAFSGHTEHLLARSGCEDVVMMLAAGRLRVALATTHMPLSAVPAAITAELLTRRLKIVHDSLQREFGIARPKIAVTGLNPHAGESGHLGHEERDIIAPVCVAMRATGMDVSDPMPADTVFAPRLRDGFDVIFAMYHDQGLAALKAVGFGEAVNVTLGLPFIRTSVDHGTALDLAGTGTIDTGSMLSALALATDLVAHRENR
jgi:4-hydroxythreonine-4-phosphate dehydrogenase